MTKQKPILCLRFYHWEVCSIQFSPTMPMLLEVFSEEDSYEDEEANDNHITSLYQFVSGTLLFTQGSGSRKLSSQHRL